MLISWTGEIRVKCNHSILQQKWFTNWFGFPDLFCFGQLKQMNPIEKSGLVRLVQLDFVQNFTHNLSLKGD